MAEADFRNLPCATPGVEAVLATSKVTLARHSHDQFGVGAMQRGAHRSHSGRGQVEAASGDTITVNPGEVHDGAPIGDEGRSWSMLYFAPSLITDAVEGLTGAADRNFAFTHPVVSDARVTRRFQALFRAETTATTSLRREELLLKLAAPLCAGTWRPAAPFSIRQARERIDDDPAASPTLDALARLVGMSRFQLIRSFEREIGLTPHAYVVQRRLELARERIQAGNSLADAAQAAGFADQSHMTRAFKARFGFTPGAWARVTRRNFIG